MTTNLRQRRRLSLSFDNDISRTKQSFRDECDVNHIMRPYEKIGAFPEQTSLPQYFDLTSLPSNFQEMQDIVINAQEQFMALPAQIRKKFYNDPAQFVDFCQDPANQEQLYDMGLAERPQEQQPQTASAVASEQSKTAD